MDALVILLRFVHVAAAIAWAGGAFFLLSVLDPLMGRLGVADANRFMRHIQLRTKLAAYFPVVAVLTTAAGIALYFRLNMSASYPMGTTAGQMLALGMAAGILAFAWGVSMEGRVNARIGKLARRMESSAPDPSLEQEMAEQSLKLRRYTRVSGALMVVAIFGMGTFQYF